MKEILHRDPHSSDIFKGVHPSNHLSGVKIRDYPSAIIANTDSCEKPGSHWVCFYFEGKDKAQFFDSYGLSPNVLHETFPSFLQNNCKGSPTYNQKCLQSPFSKMCGEFCTHYILQRSRGVASEDIIRQQFTDDLVFNDNLVAQYVEEYKCRYLD